LNGEVTHIISQLCKQDNDTVISSNEATSKLGCEISALILIAYNGDIKSPAFGQPG
jgi:hypothetical protein